MNQPPQPTVQLASEFQSLVDLLRIRALKTPDRLAYQILVDGQTEGPRLTYRQLHDAAQAVAARLLQVAQCGDRALLLYPPGQEFLIAFFGCLRAGIIAVPLPPPDAVRIMRALPRLQSVIQDANASLVLTTCEIQASLRGHFDAYQDIESLSWIDTESIIPNESTQTDTPGTWLPITSDIAFLQYTSGSTSTPKGVMVSHGNVLEQCRLLKIGAGYDEHSITCTWMPYHHDYGLIEGLIQPLYTGVPCYFLSPVAFVKRPHRWLEAISKYGVTHSQAPNFAYDLCVKKVTPEQRSQLDLSHWKVAAIGAEPIRTQTMNSFLEKFHSCGLKWRTIAPAYGLAEATLVVSHTWPGLGPVILSVDSEAFLKGKVVESTSGRTISLVSCGQVLSDTQVEVVNPQSCLRCNDDEVGEIWVAGPSVAQGYWNRPDDTEYTFHAHLADTNQGSFLRTGDLGCLKDGQLYVTGREKDLIIIRGLNHYPQDIEYTVETSHPALRTGHGAAFSIEVNGAEELVIVYEIQGKQVRSLDVESVLSAIRSAVFNEHDLQVHTIWLLKPGEVPKTTSGKIQRRMVQAAVLEDLGGAIAKWQAADLATTNTDNGQHSSSLASSLMIQQWIINWLADQSTVTKATTPASKFADCGIDSVRAVQLANDLEVWLKRRVEPTVFWQYATIETLSARLAGDVNPCFSESERNFACDSIAIIGIGCRFPGHVKSPADYWQLLREGRDAISEIPSERWNIADYFDSNPAAVGKMYARHGGFIDNVAAFDAAFFGIAPREAADLDPQHRLLLEVAWESLEHAGIAPSHLRGQRCGVFVGLSADDYAASQFQASGLDGIDAYKILGTARSFAAGRVAYILGLHGPVLQLDTACSSSLVAVYQACQSLQAGECSLALAGGVNLILSPATMISLCKLTALAADGKCKAFDAAADGYVRGEGCGMVVLKRSADAIRDGDLILATIRAAVVNHDGASNGLTAPNGQAQEQLLRAALSKAQLTGHQVSYIEAHGTGTKLGDPIELASINAVYNEHRTRTQPLYVGSLKANLGHLEAAAGIAGLIKVVLMLQNKEIPQQLNFMTPNPHFAWDRTALQVPTTCLPWPETDPQGLAAISSFGFSGTNAHLIVEGSHQRVRNGPPSVSDTLPMLLPLSANSKAALMALVQEYIELIHSQLDCRIHDICFTAATTREHFKKYRLAVVASSRDELIAILRDHASGTCGRIDECKPAGDIGFLFTGQGTQYPGMGRELYQSQPVFRNAINRCDELLRNLNVLALTDVLYGETAAQNGMLDQTIYTQPALFALQYALVELWKSWGIRPAAVIGHSAGEYAAACVAGVFSLKDGLALVATRGQLMNSLPPTGMMAVAMTSEARVQAAIDVVSPPVSIASINGPDNVVISGERESVEQVLASLRADGIDVERLITSHAGHSALMDPILEPFRAVAETLTYSPPFISMVSNVSGRLAGEEVACGSYWVKHVREPVRFAAGMNALVNTGCRTLIEIGPNPNLLAMGMACVTRVRPRPQWLPSVTKGRRDSETILYSLAELYVSGAEIDWHVFHQPFKRERLAIPTYPFARQSFPLPAFPVGRVTPGTSFAPATALAPAPQKSCLPSPQAVANMLHHWRNGLEDESLALTVHLDEAAVQFVIAALFQLGFNWHLGAEIDGQVLLAQIPLQHHPKVIRVLSHLVERGLLARIDGLYRVLVAAAAVDALATLAALQRAAEYPECDLIRRAGVSLAAIWKGEVEPLSILFPAGNTDQALSFYRHSKLLVKYNALAAAAVREALAQRPANKSLRVLEVGAGTGGLTSFLLPLLSAEQTEYLFTDVSPLFLHAAKERFHEFAFLQTRLLDIGKPLESQDIEIGSYDLVVAGNVLHATPRLQPTLTHVRQLLKPGGWLLLIEGANPPLWGDMVFTLMDGWWNFEDKELRPDYPLLRCERWLQLLNATGFEEVAYLNDDKLADDSQITLYLASTNLTPEAIAKTAPLMTKEEERENRVVLTDVVSQRQLAGIVREHAARVMRLKPADIEPSQPLSELGLDSLMATELRAQLGETFERELALNALQMRRSVDEIASYIGSENAQQGTAESTLSDWELPDQEVDAPRAHLVTLQAHGTKTPLFFIPAGYGDLIAFQQISHAIGMSHPVYGLQPASAKRVKTFRQMSIYRLVSAYIAEIKKVQPQGPYFLSGYSAGAIIAVELARELMRQGEPIGLLVIFDPPSHVPFWLDVCYQVNYRLFVASGLVNLVGGLRSRFARRLFHTVLDEGLRTHTSVTSGHRVAAYPGRITYFRARLSQSSLVSMQPAGWFWRRTAQAGIEVHWIPGTHYGMLRGSGAGIVVDELRDCLERATVSPNER